MGAPNHRKLSEGQARQIAELRERGWSYGRLAMKFGASPGAIHYQCLKQGAFTPRTRGKKDVSRQPLIHAKDGRTQRRFTPDEDARIQELSLQGKKISEIVKITGRAPTSVRIRLMTLALHEEMEAARAPPILSHGRSAGNAPPAGTVSRPPSKTRGKRSL